MYVPSYRAAAMQRVRVNLPVGVDPPEQDSIALPWLVFEGAIVAVAPVCDRPIGAIKPLLLEYSLPTLYYIRQVHQYSGDALAAPKVFEVKVFGVEGVHVRIVVLNILVFEHIEGLKYEPHMLDLRQ